MAIKLLRTDSEQTEFVSLVKLLDQDLAIRDGDDHAFYHQFNKIDSLKNVVVLYENDKAVSCGAFKPYSGNSVEIKRMFTLSENRGKGLAAKVLAELETWAHELGFESAILETGVKQPEAIALYRKCGYAQIPNFGQYAGIENSLCFEKSL